MDSRIVPNTHRDRSLSLHPLYGAKNRKIEPAIRFFPQDTGLESLNLQIKIQSDWLKDSESSRQFDVPIDPPNLFGFLLDQFHAIAGGI